MWNKKQEQIRINKPYYFRIITNTNPKTQTSPLWEPGDI